MMKLIKLVFLCILVTSLFACGPMAEDLPFTSLQSLNESPASFEGETIKVQGHVTEFLGEDSHLIALPYVTTRSCKVGDQWTVCTDVKINFSHVRVAEFLFQSGNQTIVVSEKSGGLYLPIPYSPAGKPTLPEGEILIIGRWSVKQDGSYALYVSGTEEIPATATPSK